MVDSEDERAAEARRQRRLEKHRAWKKRNPDRVKESMARYRATHVEEIRAQKREGNKRRKARARAERQRREAKRAYAREWYAKNRERHLANQHAYRTAQKAADPEKYRDGKRARNKRWRDSHKEQENAKLRAKYRDDPSVKSKRAAAYYAAHTEEVKARRRAYYAANRERQLATQRVWREREKRRRDAGLPPRRLRRTPPDERRANDAAADEFFTRPRTCDEITAIRKTRATRRELRAARTRESHRARAAHHLATQKEIQDRLAAELAPGPPPLTPEDIEEARLEAIGREVNQRLRHREPPRRVHHLDPAAPHPMLTHHSQTGLNR